MEEYAQEPCPWRIVDDCGRAFTMAGGGGARFSTIKCGLMRLREGLYLFLYPRVGVGHPSCPGGWVPLLSGHSSPRSYV
uniref:Uncharacterized protein n=1 Tax=Bos indicus x Bos taurus TaxID=30522 RepID=A0A4W2INX1_BOBOX